MSVVTKKNSLKRQIPVVDEFEGMTFDVEFLEELVYEWVRRMMFYSDFSLADSIIQSMAIQFKLVLHLNWFFPTKDWLNKFRNTYDLDQLSTKSLSVGCKEGKSVQVRDIVRELIPKMVANKTSVQEIAADLAVSKTINEEPALETIVIPDDDTEEMSFVDIEDELPSSVCTAFGSTTVQRKLPQKEPLHTPEILATQDIEDFLPSSVCTVPAISTAHDDEDEQQQSGSTEASYKTREYNDDLDDGPEYEPSIPIQNTLHPTASRKNRKRKVLRKQALKELEEVFECKNDFSSSSSASVECMEQTTWIVTQRSRRFSQREPLKSRNEALKCVKLIEEFAMVKENFRLIGLAERLETLIRRGN